MPIPVSDPVYTDVPTLAEQLNDKPLANFDAHAQEADFGHLLETVPAYLAQYNLTVATPAAQANNGGPVVQPTSPNQLSTLSAIQLPPQAKAAYILRASVRAGTATVPAASELTVESYGTTPSTQQIAIAPNGDIVVLAADAWTDLDVLVACFRLKQVVLTLPVVTNVATLPTGLGVQYLEQVNALVGTSTGYKVILVPGSGSPSAGQARLNLAKGTVTFASGDAVTQAQIWLGCAPTTKAFEALTSAATTP
jgi:hypothetical protein